MDKQFVRFNELEEETQRQVLKLVCKIGYGLNEYLNLFYHVKADGQIIIRDTNFFKKHGGNKNE